MAFGGNSNGCGLSRREGAEMCFSQTKAIGALMLWGLLLAGGASGRVYADPPAGWGGGGKGYELSVDKTEKHAGKASGSIKSVAAELGRFASLTQAFQADAYRGKRLRMTAHVKSKEVEDWAGLWVRVDGKDQTGLAFDNMQDRQIKGTNDWKKYEVVLDVPGGAAAIYFGILLAGKGQVWVDDFKFEAVGKDVKTTGKEVEPRKRERELRKDLPKEPKNLDFEQ
jgi:hypothetical protein